MNTTLLQNIVEHAAIAVAAIGGVLAARGKRIDLFGVVVLALVTSFGGGTARDVLVGDFPVAWLRVPDYLLNATLTALVTFAIVRRRELPRTALLVADAFALALFTIIGTAKGHSLSLSPPVCVLLGVTTGVAGGIVRDVLLGEIPLVFQPKIHLYATAALAGGVVFVSLKAANLVHWPVTLISIGVVLALRLGGIWLKLTLPVLETRKGS
jgi:uncharacterized membrane protein YeiH